MKLKQHLIEGDPIGREPGLDAFHAQAMRQRVILEAQDAERDGFGDSEREGFSRAITLWWLRPSRHVSPPVSASASASTQRTR
jgi:hypothetical protein